MALSKFQRICKILEAADGPLTGTEIAAKDSRLESREVGIVIHYNNPGEILITRPGRVRYYQLAREVRA